MEDGRPRELRHSHAAELIIPRLRLKWRQPHSLSATLGCGLEPPRASTDRLLPSEMPLFQQVARITFGGSIPFRQIAARPASSL